jgi:hypothetical protein
MNQKTGEMNKKRTASVGAIYIKYCKGQCLKCKKYDSSQLSAGEKV